MTDELKIKVTADTKSAQKDLEDVGKKVDETGDKTDKAKGKWEQIGQALSEVSPTFKKVSDSWSDTSSKIDASFGKSSAAAGLFKLGVVGALAAIAVQAAQAAAKFAHETAKMFDPQGYSKAAGQMQSSIKKLKTSIGSFTAPIVNGAMTVVAKVADGITWLLNIIRTGIAVIWGAVKAVLQPVINGFKQIVEWIKTGINTLAGFLGFGNVFEDSAKSAEDTADSMGEVVEATSAGLASFDKLNTIDMSGSGDAETAAEINANIAKAEQMGSELVSNLGNFFSNLDLGNVWQGFVQGAGEAWQNVKTKATEVWNGIGSKIGEMWGNFLQWGREKWDSIKIKATEVWNAIGNVIGGVWNWMTEKATEVWNAILGVATAVWNGILSVVTGVWNAIVGVATAAWDGIKAVAETAWNIISAPIQALWSAFQTAGEAVWGVLESVGKTFNENVIDPIKNAIGWCMEKIEWVLDKLGAVGDFFGGIGDGIGNAVGGLFSGAKSFLGLASGGAVAPNSPSPYILGDNTREYEVVSPVSLMEKAVMSALAKSGGTGSSQPVELVINLDGRKLARAIYDPLETEGRRRGSGI